MGFYFVSYYMCILILKETSGNMEKVLYSLFDLATFLEVLVYCFNFEFIYPVFLYISGTHLIQQKRCFFKTIQTIHCTKKIIDCTFTMRFKVLQRCERYEKKTDSFFIKRQNQ